MEKQPKSLLLVANAGGHLSELFALHEFWSQYDHTWVTFENEHSSFLMDMNEKVIYGFGPTHRYLYKRGVILNYYKNIRLAYRLLSSGKFDVVVSTGAGIGVIFVYMANLFKLKSIFIDSLSRPRKMSMSAKLVRRIADINLTQWEYIALHNLDTLYKGKVI